MSEGAGSEPGGEFADDLAEELTAGAGDEPAAGPAPRRRRTLWWPAALAAAVALCLGVPALLVSGSSAAGTVAAAPATDSPDAGFARDMSTHHQQAIDLSFIIMDRTSNAEVRNLAFDIINTQANQRGMMMGWLAQWGLTQNSPAAPMAWMKMSYQAHDGSLMPGMATDTQLDKLRSLNGKDAEIFYLQLMLEHHKGGVAMAQGYVALGQNQVEKNLAQSMVTAQTSEIQLMTNMLAARGAQPLSS